MDTLRTNFYQLAVFVEAMNRRSLTRAAEALMVTQPVVSRIVRNLEREYGAELMRREGNAVIPTESGEALLQLARTTLRAQYEARKAIRDLARVETGHLRLGITSSAYERATPILAAFFARYPEARINVRVDSSITIADAVRAEQLDAGVVIVSHETSFGLESTHLWDEEFVPIIAPGHPLLDAAPSDPAWGEVSIVATASSGHRSLIAERLVPLLPKGNDYPVVQCGSPQFVRELVHEGVGIGMLPLISVEDDLQHGRIARLQLSDDPILSQMHFIASPHTAKSAILRRVYRELVDGRAARAGDRG